MAKRERTTKRQIETMISFIEDNKEMSYTNAENKEQYDSLEKKWEEIKNILNALEGPVRTIKQWKTVFSDLKTNTKRRARLIRAEMAGTGSGPPKNKPLNEQETRIINLLNPVVIEGVPSVSEPGLGAEEWIGSEIGSEASSVGGDGRSNVATEEVGVAAGEEVDVPLAAQAATSKTPRTKRFRAQRSIQKPYSSSDSLMKQLIESNNNIAKALNNIAEAISNK